MSLINNIVDKLTEYFQVRIDKIKLDLIAQVSKLLAIFMALILIGIAGFFFFIFGSIALGAFLNAVLESVYLGYLILSGFYFLIMIIIFILIKTKIIQRWMEALFLSLSENLNDHD